MLQRTSVNFKLHRILASDIANVAVRREEFLHIAMVFRRLMISFWRAIVQPAQCAERRLVGRLRVAVDLALRLTLQVAHLEHFRLLIERHTTHGQLVLTRVQMYFVFLQNQFALFKRFFIVLS